jgi:hypothetical protein
VDQPAGVKKPAASLYLDDMGIPVSVYGVIQGQHVGAQRSIVAVADKGLDYWNRINPTRPPVILSYSWEEGRDLRTANGLVSDISPAEGMINCADWLLDNIDRCDGYSVWRYAYPSFYGTRPGWRCAHAQGQAVQLMLRTHEATGDRRYLDCALSAIQAFYRTVEEDGLTEKLGPTQWWYHKFADVNCERPRVLNGMLFALLGLYDAHLRTGSTEARELFEHGVAAASDTLHLYDQGEWSAYNAFGAPSSRHYHEIHCRQLALIVGVTQDRAIKEVLDRWRRGDTGGATGGLWEMRQDR